MNQKGRKTETNDFGVFKTEIVDFFFIFEFHPKSSYIALSISDNIFIYSFKCRLATSEPRFIFHCACKLQSFSIVMSTSSFCQRGRELLSDLQRSDFLPPYDDDGVRVLLLEMEVCQIHWSSLPHPQESYSHLLTNSPPMIYFYLTTGFKIKT